MQDIQKCVSEVVKRLFNVDEVVELTRPDEQFGDYSTNVAMQLVKTLGQNPRAIAEQIADALRTDLSEVIKNVVVAGPGFINLTLTDVALLAAIAGKVHAVEQKNDAERVVIETYNPNPLKQMHIGHAYNSIVADTIANLLEAGGSDVHRVSYHGDVGAHVGKSMWAVMRAVDEDPERLDDVPTDERVEFLSKKYAEGSSLYKEDETAKAEMDMLARQSFAPEGDYKKIYDTVVAWSFDDIEVKVAKLGSKKAERRFLESQSDPVGVKIVQNHVGRVFAKSQGAVIFDGAPHKMHTVVFVASNGNGLYAARDLGLIKLKNDAFSPDRSIIVTGSEQKQYFEVVLKSAELAMPEVTTQTINIPTGLVKLSTGKMSSRTGDVLGIQWIFDQIERAIIARGGTNDPDLLVGALRYAFLKVRIGSDVVFDVEEALSIQGNSGPYLQYAHVRARSILAKTAPDLNNKITDLEADERSLARKISEYPEVLQRSVDELMPHHICTYLYELAQTFNRFYEHNRVVGDPREGVRTKLVQLYADVLKNGLLLLGINAPEKM